MVDMINALEFPRRKNEFKKMVGQIGSQNQSGNRFPKSKNQPGMLLSKPAIRTIPLDKQTFDNPELWKNFQKQYQHEFNEKVKLMDKIRHKKNALKPSENYSTGFL
jgi:predicted GH43/DUF377 family glycosyl hydrolase